MGIYKQKTVGILQIRYREAEKIYLDLLEKSGENLSELIRRLIREYGKEKFPEEKLYAKVAYEKLELLKQKTENKEKFEKMDNEEYARDILKARIKGNEMIFITSQGYPVRYPLTAAKMIEQEEPWITEVHKGIIEGTFTYANGKYPDETEKANLMKALENA